MQYHKPEDGMDSEAVNIINNIFFLAEVLLRMDVNMLENLDQIGC